MLNSDDFLSGKFDNYFQMLNGYQDNVDQYTPIRPRVFSQKLIDQVVRSNPLIPYIISSWQSNVGANGSEIVVDIGDDQSDSTKARKNRIKKSTYRTLYTDHKWDDIQGKVIEYVAQEGSAILMLNKNGNVIVESIYRFNVYKDDVNKIARYAYIKDGVEVAGMKDLRHGVDLWHIKDPVFSKYVVPPSRLEVAYQYIHLEQKVVKLNISQFAHSWIHNLILKLNPKEVPKIIDETKDKEGRTWLQRFMDQINDRFSGVEKAGRVGTIPGLEEIFEPGKSNRDSQTFELLKQLTPERIAWAYSMTNSNIGAGSHLTENNAATFDDALYDKFGRHVEQQLDNARNDWLLAQEGVFTNENFYARYIPPEDPNRLEEVKQWLEDWKNGTITKNEYREKRGLPPLPDGDQTKSDTKAIDPNADQNVVDVQTTKKKQKNEIQPFFTKAVEFASKTPTEKAWESEEYTTLENRWNKAITNQINSYLKEFEKVADSELENFTVTLPKIESFYDFKTCKNDLLKFAGMGLDTVKKDKRTKFKANFWDGEYPESVLNYIDKRVVQLLKGTAEFKSIDNQTASEVESIIKNNASQGVAAIAKVITEQLPNISKYRATLIAQTEVTYAVEGTRSLMYKDQFPEGTKERQTGVIDVCQLCIQDESQGQIGINELFSSQTDYPPVHPRCGCTNLYFP